MTVGLTLDSWRSRLEGRGHRVTEPARETVTGFTLWPDPGVIVTVAVEPDPTLRPQYRQQFFVLEPEPEQVFRVLGCPRPHRTRWLELVSLQAPGYWQECLAGPGSWLLSRLSRFRQVVVWADRGLPWDVLDCPTHRGWGMAVPAEAAPLFAATAGVEASQPRLLCVEEGRFADAVAACMLFASVGMRDCYLADEAGAEVYLAHHHDKVVVSVPDAGARSGLLRDLDEAPWLFSDVSGYGASPDDEDDQDGEWQE
jgi:hypothetical protein